MSEVVVVGAGLSGLVAAINCSRAGHQVRVLEAQKEVGGDPVVHPGVDSTPMRPRRLGEFLGIELSPPQVTATPLLRADVFGKSYEMEGAGQQLHAIERGSRSTSLDSYLHEMALAQGVRFEFGWRLRTPGDIAQLPPGSIIATGLNSVVFEALKIPYREVYGYICNGRYEGPPVAELWLNDRTRDYCYLANVNGIAFALFFDRRPVKRSYIEEWSSKLREREGLELEEWREYRGAVGTKTIGNPGLLAGDKIVAGALAGMNDPVFLFGVHGSLVSGRLAAMAVDDKEKALQVYRRMLPVYRISWTMSRMMGMLPMGMRRAALKAFLGLQFRFPRVFQGVLPNSIPGFRIV